jgi:hypothetical protein
MYNHLDKTTNKLLRDLELMQKLSSIAGKKDYPGKLRRIREKLIEEINLFEKKNHPQRLQDLKKDLIFVDSQRDAETLNKERIDELVTKYNIGYGETRKTN